MVHDWDCDNKGYCPNVAATCRKETQLFGLKSCSGSCCTTDNCNNPNSGTGVIAAKFSICLMIILGYFLA